MKKTSQTDAVMVANDAMAVVALRYLHDAGIQVPDEVALVIFGDTVLTNYTYPSLTAVKVSIVEMVEMAVRQVQLRQTNQKIVPTKMVVGTQLIKRGSAN